MNGIYRFGEFRLDAGRRLLTRHGDLLSITPKALDVLVFLIQNRGRIVTKEELLEKLWKDTFVEEGILKFNVSAIRKTLGAEAWIETQPRRGYRFAGEVLEESATADAPAIVEETRGGVSDKTQVTVAVEGEMDPSKTSWRWAAIAFALVACAAAWMLWNRGKAAPKIRTLAVLPFQSISAAGSNIELELGLTDSLIARLGSEGRWLVRPTGAVRSYTGSTRDPLAAGHALEVDVVLDGSIQRSGDRLRLTLQLLRVSDGKHLWTGKFDEKLTELFEMEDRITGQVAQALHTAINPVAERKHSGDAEVYQLYLASRHFLNEDRPASTRQAIQSLEQAIRRDPGFAPAYGMLAFCYWQLAQLGVAPPPEMREKLRSTASKAVELDEASVEGHVALAFSRMLLDFDWDGARKEFRRAIELNPNEPTAYMAWGIHAISNGRFEETEQAYRKHLDLNPRAVRSVIMMGFPLYYAGRYDEAISWFRKALAIDPNSAGAYTALSIVYDLEGRDTESVEASLKAAALSGARPERIAQRLELFRKQGIDGWRRDVLALRLAQLNRGESVSPLLMASSYVSLGENSNALDWMEKAVEQHDNNVLFLKTFPKWAPLKGEPRYHALLRKMRLE